MFARWSPLLALTLSACAFHALPAVESPDVAALERTFDEPWIVLERDLGKYALLEFASRAGSIEGGEPLVAAIVLEAMAARVAGIPRTTPGLSLIRIESTPGEISEVAERLVNALKSPLSADEIETAWERVLSLRRAQEREPSRAAILAAFEALGIPEAAPLGAEGDPLPDARKLEAFRAMLAEPAHAKWIFVGDLGERTRRRLARLFDSPEKSGERDDVEGAVPIGRQEPPPLRAFRLPRSDQAKMVAGPASWALVAALPRLEEAQNIERLIRDREPFRGASLGLAPSSAGAFLVISREGPFDRGALEFMKSELIRLSRPLLPRGRSVYRDAGEAIAGLALEFASDARGGDIVFGLGVAVPRELERDALKGHDADPKFISLPHDDFMGYGTAIAIKLEGALADEPRSEAGRTELLLESLRRSCAARGLEVEILARGGDAIARLYLDGGPPLEDVDAFIQCFLRDIPSGEALEASRTTLLRRLAEDPYQEILERLSRALSPSSSSIFFGAESKTVRDRGRTRHLIDALSELRVRTRLYAAAAGERAGAVAEQLGYALAALPEGQPERRSKPAAIGELRSLSQVEVAPIMGAGIRLEVDRGDDLSAYLRALISRLEAQGIRVLRAERSTRDGMGFIALITPLGGDDPLALRQRIEEALPDANAIEEARIISEYEALLRGSGPAARALELLDGRGERPSAPRLVGIVATLGVPADSR